MALAVNLRRMLAASAALRALLILYGEWQDAHMEVRYTDVDYLVFSDAAALVTEGGSPFGRSTYRYSPLLAYLLVPNSIIHPCWGKVLFSSADLLVGYFIYVILKRRGVPENLSLYSVAAWLFNPFTFTIGTRGNCEPIVCAIILWIIICLINGVSPVRICEVIRRLSSASRISLLICNIIQAALWYGLIVHFRIYPIIYSLSIIMVLDEGCLRSRQSTHLKQWSPGKRSISCRSSDSVIAAFYEKIMIFTSDPYHHLRTLMTKGRLIFGLISASIFFFWTILFFYLYGWEFLNEALLYHLTRTDPRHNFSIYFYHIYLHHQHGSSVLEKLVSFLPQLIVQSVLISTFSEDLMFCFFTQTVAFVAFNKVITAQYFVWFFCLLPLILPWSDMRLRWEGLSCLSAWVGSQVHWLMWGYLLEFKGKNVFLQLWLSSILFLFANVYTLVMVIRHHRFTPLLLSQAEGDSGSNKKSE